jgi:hypothetical protein
MGLNEFDQRLDQILGSGAGGMDEDAVSGYG